VERVDFTNSANWVLFHIHALQETPIKLFVLAERTALCERQLRRLINQLEGHELIHVQRAVKPHVYRVTPRGAQLLKLEVERRGHVSALASLA